VGLVDLWVLKGSRLKNRELVAIVVVARGRGRGRRRYCDLSTTNRAQGVCVLTTLYRKQRNAMQWTNTRSQECTRGIKENGDGDENGTTRGMNGWMEKGYWRKRGDERKNMVCTGYQR